MSLLYSYQFPSQCYAFDISRKEDRQYFAAGFSDEVVRVWKLDDILKVNATLDKPQWQQPGIDLGAVDLKFNSIGNRIVASSMTNCITIFNLHPDSGLSHHRDIKCPGFNSWKVDFHPNGNEVLTGASSLSSYEVSSGDKAFEVANGTKFITSLCYSPTGNLVAFGNIEGLVSIFNTMNKENECKFKDHNLPVRALKFDLSGQYIISGSEDLHINIEDIKQKKIVQTMTGHADWITSIQCPQHNPRHFLTTSLDKTIRIWDQVSRKCVRTIELDSPIWNAGFSADGGHIVGATESGAVKVFVFQ